MDKFLIAEDVAAATHLHPETVRTLARQKKIIGSRIGQRWLFTEQAVQDFVNLHSNAKTREFYAKGRKKS